MRGTRGGYADDGEESEAADASQQQRQHTHGASHLECRVMESVAIREHSERQASVFHLSTPIGIRLPSHPEHASDDRLAMWRDSCRNVVRMFTQPPTVKAERGHSGG